MSDLRDPEPPERTFQIAKSQTTTHEIELAAWVYSGCRSEKAISRKLVYRICARHFDDARAQAEIALQTVQAMHDIWDARIVRISEVGV